MQDYSVMIMDVDLVLFQNPLDSRVGSAELLCLLALYCQQLTAFILTTPCLRSHCDEQRLA